MDKLLSFLQKNSHNNVINWQVEVEAKEIFGFSYLEIEKHALKNNMLPLRYIRNLNTISIDDQLTLLNSTICVIGTGGLGGYIVEELARLGIGHLTMFDYDVFEEHNLNRQLYSDINTIGKAKVDITKDRISIINPAVDIVKVLEAFNHKTDIKYFEKTDVVIDALDNIQTKKALGKFCNENNLHLVHGAIAGWYGQIAVQPPGQNTVGKIYKNATYEKGIETDMGNPAFTPAVIGSLQVSETVKILLNKKESIKNKVYFIDLLSLNINQIQM